MSEEFLDPQLCRDLRDAINQTNIFIRDDSEKRHFSLVCAVIDRLDSAIRFLNARSDPPESEEELVSFVVYACILLDAVHGVLKELGITNPYDPPANAEDPYKFFKSVSTAQPMNLDEKDAPTDDKFFEYFRSLVFAHPFKTNRPKFFEKGEVQYSPFVIARYPTRAGEVGARVYSNLTDSIKDIVFPLILLKDYIDSRYHLIAKATDRVNATIREKQNLWMRRKVKRDGTPVEIYQDIAAILDERYIERREIERREIDKALEYLVCETTLPANAEAIELFRHALTEILPDLCDAVDSLSYEALSTTLAHVLHVHPTSMHQQAHYQLEKIYTYLIDNVGESNQSWGRKQAHDFSREFATKWVTIDAETMSFSEIRLLVTASLHFEHQATAVPGEPSD